MNLEVIGYLGMLFAGGSLGLIGGGGAILTVPIMVYLFNVPAVLATTYSLFVVGAASSYGVWHYHHRCLVDYSTATHFALPSFLGTFLARRLFLPELPDVLFSWGGSSVTKDQLVLAVFALVMLGASSTMIRGGRGPTSASLAPPRLGRAPLALLGLTVGFVAGFVGAGGGFLIIPALVVLAGLAIQRAVGTSLLLISANSLFGFGVDMLGGTEVNWLFLGTTSGVAVVGLFLGSFASTHVPVAKLKPAFGWFVLVMGTLIFCSQFV